MPEKNWLLVLQRKKKLKNARTRPQEPRKRWNAKHLVLCGRPQKKKRKKTTMICT
jgi:hypothetical protein